MEHGLQLKELYFLEYHNQPDNITVLDSISASPRKYFRIRYEQKTWVGVFNADRKENQAFIHFTKTFKKAGIRVPELYAISENELYYLVEDLGDLSLYDILKQEGESQRVKHYYHQALEQLLKIQLYGKDQIDFDRFAYPRADFDKQSVLWDLNYFKYYFLKLTGISFDEQKLEDEFHFLAKEIEKQKLKAFMFRDFQSRNLQIHQDSVYMIDYQGGRRGPMLYDLVSLIYQASANLSPEFRGELKEEYKKEVRKSVAISDADFNHDFNSILFIRIIQTLGAYGFRGWIEKKPYFIESIPLALENLEMLLNSEDFKVEIPYFIQLMKDTLKLKSKFAVN